MRPAPLPNASELASLLVDARNRTLELAADLTDGELEVPHLPIVNPLRWELGHIAWFQERWILRHRAERAPLRVDADALYDSSAVPHAARWELPLPARAQTLRYMDDVLQAVLERLAEVALDADERYFHQLVLFHEDMHGEALFMTRQTLRYREPALSGARNSGPGAGACPGDAAPAGGTLLLGSEPGRGFVFDNEKWAHAVDVAPFQIARAPVTQGEYAEFVDAGGYGRGEYWSEEGWLWRERAEAVHPLYWKRNGRGCWLRLHFDREVELEPHRPMLHVNAHEAEAYCRFAGRRLPTEAEWEFAAGWLLRKQHTFPWGERPHEASLANLDGVRAHAVDVGAHPLGDSPHGLRQMLGNVWEWTASKFLPYPGFVADPYHEYSAPWFGTHRVLRGGSFATRARLIHNRWRNFYEPHRRDVFAGFRTCAL